MSRHMFRVRPATHTDVPSLVELIDESTLAAGGRQVRVQESGTLADRVGHLLDDSERTILVAIDESAEQPIGLVVLGVDQVAAINPVTVLTMSHLYVAATMRRRGIGRALMAAAVQEADQRGIDHLVATALTGSRDVNRYLARLGFAPMVTRRLASTQVLRRALGLNEAPGRVARMRRLRTARGGSAQIAVRAARRGA